MALPVAARTKPRFEPQWSRGCDIGVRGRRSGRNPTKAAGPEAGRGLNNRALYWAPRAPIRQAVGSSGSANWALARVYQGAPFPRGTRTRPRARIP